MRVVVENETAFGESHREKHIRNVPHKRKRGLVGLIAAVLAMLLCGCSFLTESADTDSSEDNWNGMVVKEEKVESNNNQETAMGSQDSGKSDAQESAAQEPIEDYAGLYVDTQGTGDIYSQLNLLYLGDGLYDAVIGLYRLTTLEGTAKVEGEVLSFEDEVMQIKGGIIIQDTGAVFRVTESEFEYINSGDVFEFPEKR